MDRLKLLVGCPVRDRQWIIDKWIWYVDEALKELDQEVDMKFIFAGSPRDNTMLHTLALAHQGHAVHVELEEDTSHSYSRAWSRLRYIHMVEVRNALLAEVRRLGPDYFVSLDCDILPHPMSLRNMFETLNEKGALAVGGKTYLSGGTNAPNYGVWSDRYKKDGIIRKNSDQVLPVDVLMAYKLMTPAAYHKDYDVHHTGEDAGWSLNFSKGELYWDGRVVSKHVMQQIDLITKDRRCGY